MRKKALGIIGGVVLVAALGTASFFLLRNAPEEDSSSVSSSDSSEESISLTSEDPNDVTSIDITNGSGSFAVVRTAGGKLQQVRNGFPVHYDAGSTGGYQ